MIETETDVAVLGGITMQIRSIEPTPSPNTMKLTLDQALGSGKSNNYTKDNHSDAPKEIQELFKIEGIKGVYHVADFIALEREPKAKWEPVLQKARQVFGEDTKEDTNEEQGNRYARELADAFLHQVLIDGLFHSDPHPGNFSITKDDQICMFDFGQVGRLNKTMRNQFISYVIAMTRRDIREVTDTIYAMADVPDTVDHEEFGEEVEFLLDKYYEQSFEDIKIGEAIRDIFAASHRYNIRIYKEYTLLAKAVITIESILMRLDPNLSIVEIAEPYGRQLARERLNPKSWTKELYRDAKKQSKTILALPDSVKRAVDRIGDDDLSLEVRMPKINLFFRKLDRISNRISFSITLLAFSIIMVGLIIGSSFGDQNSFLVQLPVIEISFVVSFFMFLLILYSILKSGRF